MVITSEETGVIGVEEATTELVQETLLTLPAPVWYGEMSFVYKGVPEYGSRKNMGEEEYLSACSQFGIRPLSRIKIEYDRDLGTFAPSKSLSNPSFLDIYQSHSERFRQSAINGLFTDGKIHTIEAKTENPHQFQIFTTDFLRRVFDADYTVGDCDLWLSTYRLSGYNEGTYRNGGLFVNRGFRAGQSLKRIHGMEFTLENPPEERAKLVNWFRDLAKKHKTEIYV